MFTHDGRVSTRLLAKALCRLSCLPLAVVVNSWAGKGFHQEAGYRPRHWAVIPNGIDTGTFRPNAEARRDLRAQWKVGEHGRVICHAARPHPMKGQQVFLSVVRAVLERHEDAHVVMAGGAVGALPEWPSEIAGRLHVLGRRKDMAAVYAASDLFCLSSIYGEGFPNVVAEAMACGLPCVGTDVGDTARIIGDTGLTVPPADSGALGRALAELAAAPPDRLAALGAAARARIVSEFDLEKVASAYVDFYGSLLEQLRLESCAALRVASI
ncbi:MAG: glycosyltransferase [Alphaproteobacteria bacterium]